MDWKIIYWISQRFRLPGCSTEKNKHHQGKSLSQYVEESGLSKEEALINLLIEEKMAVLLVFNMGDDRLVDPVLQHDLYMMGTDGIYMEGGMIHPRQFGSAARLLGPCVRDHKLFSLEDAVYKLSGAAANRFGLGKRSQLKEGYFADLVVFDPQTVQDNATYQNPQQFSSGINHVISNGCPYRTGQRSVTDSFGNTSWTLPEIST